MSDSATLCARALDLLDAVGVMTAQWPERNGMGEDWTGDVCGCPDNRCIGFHHRDPTTVGA